MLFRSHAAELPFYLAILWWLLTHFGIEGAAIAWLLRVSVDMVVLFFMAHRLMPCAGFLSRLSVYLGVSLFALLLGVLLHGAMWKGVYILTAPAIFAITAWSVILSPEERAFARSRVRAASNF